LDCITQGIANGTVFVLLYQTNSEVKHIKVLKSSEENGNTLKVEAESDSGPDNKLSEQNPAPPEPLKQDYIHVRARRGQATDSHSLAERVSTKGNFKCTIMKCQEMGAVDRNKKCLACHLKYFSLWKFHLYHLKAYNIGVTV
jgi:hypothetical protein